MKTIKVLKVKLVEEEIPLIDFINSKSAYFEYIDKERDTCYIPEPDYPNENFMLVLQEVETSELSYHEIGYVICPTEPEHYIDAKNYVLEHINEFVALEL